MTLQRPLSAYRRPSDRLRQSETWGSDLIFDTLGHADAVQLVFAPVLRLPFRLHRRTGVNVKNRSPRTVGRQPALRSMLCAGTKVPLIPPQSPSAQPGSIRALEGCRHRVASVKKKTEGQRRVRFERCEGRVCHVALSLRSREPEPPSDCPPRGLPHGRRQHLRRSGRRDPRRTPGRLPKAMDGL